MRLSILLASLLAAGCLLKDERSAKRGSEVENQVYGALVDESGNAVAGAEVTAVPEGAFTLAKASAPAPAVESVFTDNQGKYAFLHLPAGIYNIIGSANKGAQVVLIPAVNHADTTQKLDLGADTLMPPGKIRGRVIVSGAGRGGVIGYLPGTSYLAITDTGGFFTMTGVPEGKYGLHYLVQGYSAIPDTGIVVLSGETTVVPDKVLGYDTTQPPPAPIGLEAAYDTLSQTVMLRWKAVSVADLLGYLIYRDTGSFTTPTLLNPFAIADTIYRDTLPQGFWPAGGRKLLSYRVKSIDRQRNQSPQFSGVAEVPVAPASEVTTSLSWRAPMAHADPVSIGDTVTAVVVYSNPSRNLSRVAWFQDAGMDTLRVISLSQRSGADTLKYAWKDPGPHQLRVEIRDDAGTLWKSGMGIEVVLDPPVAVAGRDTTVSIGDAVRLTGSAINAFGKIAKWEWDIGNTGVFQASLDGSKVFTAAAVPESLTCVLRVTDDDGLAALDTMMVKVVADVPKASAAAIHGEVFVGETFRLSGSASSDGYGRIVKWEWDVGNTGAFSRVSGPDTQLIAGAVPDSNLRCVLRVTDDDGNRATAEVRVIVHDRSGWIKASEGNPFFAFSDFKAWVFNGKAWVAGFVDGGITGYPEDPVWQVWNTDDMQNWTRVDPLDAPNNWPTGTPFQVLAGKIWGIRQTSYPSVTGVWASADGANWWMVSAPSEFADKVFGCSAVLNNKLWLYGVFDNVLNQGLGEIYASADGVGWQKVADSTALGDRAAYRSCVKDGKLWIYGGFLGDSILNDIWSSADGAHWTRISEKALPGPRVDTEMLTYKGELWLFRGEDENGDPSPNVWHSADGILWSAASERLPAIPPHASTRVLEFKGRLWMLASYLRRDHSGAAEVWLAPR